MYVKIYKSDQLLAECFSKFTYVQRVVCAKGRGHYFRKKLAGECAKKKLKKKTRKEDERTCSPQISAHGKDLGVKTILLQLILLLLLLLFTSFRKN